LVNILVKRSVSLVKKVNLIDSSRDLLIILLTNSEQYNFDESV